MKHTLSGDVLTRMLDDLKMTEEQFEQLYDSHRKSMGGVRFKMLDKKISNNDLDMLTEYLNKGSGLSVNNLATKYGYKKAGQIYTIVTRLCLQLVYQNWELLQDSIKETKKVVD